MLVTAKFVSFKPQSRHSQSCAFSVPGMVLYVFEVLGTDYIEMGYTSGCPWGRIRDGFWKQVHPTGVCGKLGWDDLNLIALSPGSLEDEALIKAEVSGREGEFWPRSQLEIILLAFKVIACGTHGCDNVNWELPLPPRPEFPLQGRGIEKLECCGGTRHLCFGCGATFSLWIRLQTHKGIVPSECGAAAGVSLLRDPRDQTAYEKAPEAEQDVLGGTAPPSS